MRALDQGQLVSGTLTVLQVLPALEGGGVERGTLEVGKYLVECGHRSLVMSAGGRMVAQLEREGSEHFAWPIGKKSLWTLRLIWKLRRFLVEQQVNILHVRSRMPAWVCYLAWKGMDPATRPHLVTTVHGPYTVNAYSAVMTQGERVIAISETIRRYILDNYPKVPPEAIRRIYRGVDPAQFPYGYTPDAAWQATWRKSYPQLEGKRVLTLPARITRWKGQEDFIELIAALKQRGLPVHGLIVGEAHPRRQEFLHALQRKTEALGVAGDITFTGHRTDLREVMAVSDIVFSLAREPEAFGRTTIEALSLGVPVIGYNHGGVGEQLAEILPEGRVAPGDSAALAARTASWLDRAPEVPQTHGFTLQAMLAATLNVYEELAGSQPMGENRVASGALTGWEKIDCPVCGGKEFVPLFEKAGEPFVRCRGCGLVMINPRPQVAQVLETYSTDYSKNYTIKASTKRRRARRTVNRICAGFVKNGRWLDVGCSVGFVVEAAQQARFEAHGVDVEAWGVHYARETLGLKDVRQGFLEAQGYPDAYFDVITCHEVIEHVPDLNAFVAELARLLKPGGVIEIRTPDIGHWRVPKLLSEWDAVKPSEHLYYFDRKTLGRLLANHGLKVRKWGFNWKPGLRAYASPSAGQDI